MCGAVREGCWTCDDVGCRDCGDEHVLENGLCRVGDRCTKSDGMSCVECADGFILFNATDCALTDECVRYEDGACVQCVGEHIAPINGTCEVEEHCVDWHDDRCKRCEPGMYLSENECLPCDENCVTCEGEADFCMSCDAAQGMYLSQNECMNNSELAGICRVFITGGGCASCVTGNNGQERTCVECDVECGSCLNGDSRLTCAKVSFMTDEDTCRRTTDIVGCGRCRQ